MTHAACAGWRGNPSPVPREFRALARLTPKQGQTGSRRQGTDPRSIAMPSHLSFELAPASQPSGSSPRNALLLTGATGFVGTAVLARILERTERRVVVPIRAGSQSEADGRLEALMRTMCTRPGQYTGRVRAVCADLTRPGLGLAGTRGWIADHVDEIIHCAASVAFNLSLAESRAINVEGTRRVLDLAHDCAAGGDGLRRMTCVSTAYVAGDRHGYAEETELNVGQGFHNAYEQSKQEAERLVSGERDRLPLTVVRPSIVVGERETGWTSSFNVMYGPLRAVAAGAFPLMPGRRGGVLDIVTVDFVADAILALAGAPDAEGGTFHVVAGDQAMTLHDLGQLAARRFARRAPRLIHPRLYRSVLHPLMLRRADPATRRRMERNEAYFPYLSLDLRFDDRRAREVLDPLGIRATPITECFDTLMDFAEAARWGREPIARSHAALPAQPTAWTPRTAEAVA
jgi:thioester reductase-like protein